MTFGDALLRMVLSLGALLATGFVLAALAGLIRFIAPAARRVGAVLLVAVYAIAGARRW